MPLEEHLHEVCARAVTEEEMQRVVESSFKIGTGRPAPQYDADYVCPLKVVEERFVDHIVEIETSKSYPGLLTMYHLYTVDIVCTGLGEDDLNTLEFDHPDKEGRRKLKYVHAWVWMEWPQIQRYLFEGSELKEQKCMGSFTNAEALRCWLDRFNVDLSQWGQKTFRSIEDLYDEIENQESELEMWGREDGVPMVMRVAHVVQLQVKCNLEDLAGKFLVNTSSQNKNGSTRVTNRLLASKMSFAQKPF